MDSDPQLGDEDGRSQRDGYFWTTIALSLFTACSAVLVAARATWSFGNRHFELPGFVDAVWEAGSYVVNTRTFAVAYLVLPFVWFGMALFWWANRSIARSRVQWLVVAALGLASIVGMTAWLASAAEQITWAFDVDWVPRVITTFGIGSADVLEPVIAIGLTILILAAVANLVLMLQDTSPGASPADS